MHNDDVRVSLEVEEFANDRSWLQDGLQESVLLTSEYDSTWRMKCGPSKTATKQLKLMKTGKGDDNYRD